MGTMQKALTLSNLYELFNKTGQDIEISLSDTRTLRRELTTLGDIVKTQYWDEITRLYYRANNRNDPIKFLAEIMPVDMILYLYLVKMYTITRVLNRQEIRKITEIAYSADVY